jgi:hypothetical protein
MENPLSTNRDAPVLGHGSAVSAAVATATATATATRSNAATPTKTAPPDSVTHVQQQVAESPTQKQGSFALGLDLDLDADESSYAVEDVASERAAQNTMLDTQQQQQGETGVDSDNGTTPAVSGADLQMTPDEILSGPEAEDLPAPVRSPSPEGLSFSYRMAASTRPSAGKARPRAPVPTRDVTPTRPDPNVRISNRRGSKIDACKS